LSLLEFSTASLYFSFPEAALLIFDPEARSHDLMHDFFEGGLGFAKKKNQARPKVFERVNRSDFSLLLHFS
jgi:hypothetical protein